MDHDNHVGGGGQLRAERSEPPMLACKQGCDECLGGVNFAGDDPRFCACPMGVALRARCT